MGLFGKRRTAVLEDTVWQPASEVLGCARELMNDDGCAGDHAYGVLLTLEGDPAVTVTIWAYASYGPSDGGERFTIGYCCDHRAGEDWEAFTYEADSRGALFDDLGDADDEARALAEQLAGGFNREGPREALSWDGVPW